MRIYIVLSQQVLREINQYFLPVLRRIMQYLTINLGKLRNKSLSTQQPCDQKVNIN